MPRNCKNNNQLDRFAEADFRSDLIYSNAKDQCYRPEKFKPVTGCRIVRKPSRVENNSDCTGLDISFDRRMNDFTNPRANPNNRIRCCPQQFECCTSNFMSDYCKTTPGCCGNFSASGTQSCAQKQKCKSPLITGGIKKPVQCVQCNNWNNCSDCLCKTALSRND